MCVIKQRYSNYDNEEPVVAVKSYVTSHLFAKVLHVHITDQRSCRLNARNLPTGPAPFGSSDCINSSVHKSAVSL